MKLEVALEWFLNPDHLPFVAGIQQGWFADAGLEVSLREPAEHYDGLAATVQGEVAFSCNEPLHMIDESRPGLKALGCFFETDGGILLTPEGGRKLREGGNVRLASPVAGEVTDEIAVEILSRWTQQQGGEPVAEDRVQIESAGFEHLRNLQVGFDGAWLCFGNFEGVEAQHLGVDVDFITTREVGLENFSALELFTGEQFLREHGAVVNSFVDILSRGAAACRDDVEFAKRVWYAYSGEASSPMMDAIVADTCTRLVSPVRRDPQRWHGMWQQFNALGIARIDDQGYRALYAEA